MKGNRRLSDFELRAEMNRAYIAEHGHEPERPFWLGDAEYLEEVRAAQARRRALDAARFAELKAKRAVEPLPADAPLRKTTGGGTQSAVQMIRAHGPLSAAQLAEHLRISPAAAQVRLWRATLAGALRRGEQPHTYALPEGTQ